MTVSNKKVSSMKNSTNICNILKGNLFAQQNLTMTISFYSALRGDSNSILEVEWAKLSARIFFKFYISIEFISNNKI